MMYLGIDTSNYTTSVALYDGRQIYQWKRLLRVKQGERGLRQSDALFQHTVNLPELMREMGESLKQPLTAVGVSDKPRNIQGSYMPCFLAGCSAAASISAAAGLPLFTTSHQIGHILAALYSVKRLDLIDREFIAFHVSGGTTEALLITPDEREIIKARIIAESSDLKAGQAIDRVGVMLGLDFPAGKELDALAAASEAEFRIKPSFAGNNCSLSGIENQCRKMWETGVIKEDISKYCIESVYAAIEQTAQLLITQYGELPLLFAGGVMSNSMIRSKIEKKYTQALFAARDFSCDNAAGIAVQAFLKDRVKQ